MSTQKLNPRTIALLAIIVAVAVLRVLTNLTDHLGPISNFTPIGAMALFGGASFRGKIKPFFFPLLALFISDLVLSFTVYDSFRSGILYSGWYWTYAAFALMVIAGKLLVKTFNARNILIAVVAATVIHWLVSDIGGCLNEATTEAMLYRYGQRLISAIPY